MIKKSHTLALTDSAQIIRKHIERNKTKTRHVFLNSVVAFVTVHLMTYFIYDNSIFWALCLSMVSLLFFVRMFAVFHDCAHNIFFKRNIYNLLLGHFIGLFFYTPFEMWREGHIKHHTNSGNLDKRHDNPDIWTMTMKEYQNASPLMRFFYRVFRNPLFYLLVVPSTLFLILFRIPNKKFTIRINLNIVILNLVIISIYVLATYTIGLKKFILLHMPLCISGFTIGAWMFYLQHQFEDSYFEHDGDFNFVKASLKGSSFYKFPKLLNWMTGNVAYHHVHHLNPAIPMYNLINAHNELSEKFEIHSLKLMDAFKAFKFKLWDEKKKKMVPFP